MTILLFYMYQHFFPFISQNKAESTVTNYVPISTTLFIELIYYQEMTWNNTNKIAFAFVCLLSIVMFYRSKRL